MLTPVEELPRSTGRLAEQFAAKEVREFLRRSMDVAMVEVPGKTAEAVRKSALGYIKAKGIEHVGAVQRGGKCYLYRTDLRGSEG